MSSSAPDPAPTAPDEASPADTALFGEDPMPRIVDVHPLMDRPSSEPAAVQLYQRTEDFSDIIEHEETFYPFFFVSDASLLNGLRHDFWCKRLDGDNFFKHVAAFPTWSAYWDAVRQIERRTDSDESWPDEIYRVGSPVQQYLMQSGRTCLLDMTLDDLHRLQLDIEVYTEGGFPNADRPEDKIIIVALSDNRGWTRLLHLDDDTDETTLLRQTVQTLRERDPDVIEGHNCFPAETPVLTPDGYASIEDLSVGDTVLSHTDEGIEEDTVTDTFANAFDGDLVRLQATYLGSITSTPDHPHYGYKKEEGIGYHTADAFNAGDYLARPSSNLTPDDLTFSENYYLAGRLFADGHLSKATNRITFGNTNHDLVEWVRDHLGGQGTIYRREPEKEQHAPLLRLRTHDPSAHAWLQSIGVPEGNKSVDEAPISFETIIQDGPSAAASFLAGVIEGDGHLSETNGFVQIAVGTRAGKNALMALAHHLGLVVSKKQTGIALWPTRTTTDLLLHILSWLQSDDKRTVNLTAKSRRPDELPFAVIEKVKPFIDRLGISYKEFPIPRTTVNYYLNGRTSIHRATFEDIEDTVRDAVSASDSRSLRQEWTQVCRDLDEIKSYHWFPIRDKTTEPSTGTVYNLETGNHNYVASGALTHNCFSFDLSYILDRCDLHGVDFAIGRDGSVPRTYDSSMRFAERTVDYPAVDIVGRHVIDTYFQVMSFDVFSRDLPDYSLKTAARYFGLAPEERTYIEGVDISRAWREDREELLDYALDDVTETKRLAGHLSGSTFYLAQMLPMTYGSSARRGPAAKIESLFVREYLRQRHALPRSEWGSQSMGGYTDIFITGVLGPIVYADVESLYPSIMLNYDVQPSGDTLDLFPTLLERLTDLRLDTKQDMREAEDEEVRSELDARQSSYKVLINSFYGLLGFSLSVFNDFAEADRVARTGQEILRDLIDEIRTRGGTVIEVDTDGVLFVPPKDVRGEEAEVDFTIGLTEAMPEGIRVGFDGRFKKMLSYKKKNYALLTYDDDLKFKGSSLISRSNEPFGRDFVRRAIRRLLDHDVEGLHILYVDTRTKIIESDWESVESFARTETLKDTLDDYEADVEDGNRPRAATYELAKQKQERTGKPVKKGDRITYYITGENAGVTAFKHCALAADWDPDAPDENTAYYLKRLNEFATKFEPFFTDEDFRLVFSEEDMFGFSPEGIEIQRREHEADRPDGGPTGEVPF